MCPMQCYGCLAKPTSIANVYQVSNCDIAADKPYPNGTLQDGTQVCKVKIGDGVNTMEFSCGSTSSSFGCGYKPYPAQVVKSSRVKLPPIRMPYCKLLLQDGGWDSATLPDSLMTLACASRIIEITMKEKRCAEQFQQALVDCQTW